MEDKTFTIEQIPEPIAFLNGTIGLFGPEDDLHRSFEKIGKEAFEIGGLFEHPERLAQLIKFNVKTIAIQTTGQNAEDIGKALDFFETLDFKPEVIILLFPDNLWCEARDFKEKNPDTLILEQSFLDKTFSEVWFS